MGSPSRARGSLPPDGGSRLADPSPLIDTLRSAGTLFLWPRARATFDDVLAAVASQAADPAQGCIRIRLATGALPACVARVVAAVSAEEALDIRALYTPAGVEPALSDFAQLTTLHGLDVLVRSMALLDQLAAGRITSHFHAIVHAGDPSRIYGHEALLRGVDRDGSLQAPLPIFDLAREAGLLLELDMAAARSAIRQSALHSPANQIFINFSPVAVTDPSTSVRAIVEAVDNAGLPHERLVFEITEADRFRDVPHLERLLSGYRAAGFRVALDDVGAGWSTLNLLHRVRPDFIKLDRELIHDVDTDGVKALIAGKLLEIGKGMGIGTIVEGVERDAELDWVRRHGADYVQGYLFGRPQERPLVVEG